MKRIPHIRAILPPDGRVAVDIDEPVGPACDDVNERLRIVMELLGAGVGDVSEDAPPRPPVPEASRTRGRS